MRKPNMSPVKTPVATLDLAKRHSGMEEVYGDYTLEEAQAEANRCLNCPYKYCMQHCPAHNYIPEFIAQIREGNLLEAWNILSRTNPFMEISGRVCPYEEQCESHCTRAIKCEAVAIGRLERFVADWHRANVGYKPGPVDSIEKKVAIVGAGPAGLTCALSLRDAGFDVTVYEASNEIGGAANWGIPSFVLPKSIFENFHNQFAEQNIQIQFEKELGKNLSLEELTKNYDSVFLATGAQIPVELTCKGLPNEQVVQAKDYLSNSTAYTGKKICVLGGGNTAIDAARTAIRQGAESVSICYRRTEADMPATSQEIALAKEEGVTILPQLSPQEFVAENGNLEKIIFTKMELSKPDYPGGRNNVVAGEDSVEIPCDLAVLALGFTNPPIAGLESDPKNRIIIDDHYMTSMENVYAGGDMVTGAATFMKAVAAGKEAACEIFNRFSPL